MSRIVFAWELGENHGHLWRLLPIARQLQLRGHEVMFGLRSVAAAQRYLAPHGIRWFACPTPVGVAELGRDLATYADILAINGATQPDLLGGMVQAWQNLYTLLQPDLIVIEHSPFALLAARRAGIRTVQVGTGFTIPPTLSPAPCFRPGLPDAAEAQRQTQEQVARTVQALFKQPHSLSRLLAADHTRLLSLRELDHYAAQRPPGTTFLGAVPEPDQGELLRWSQSGQPRLFVYLYMQPWMDTVLSALEAIGAEVIAVIPDLGADLARRHPKLRLYRKPVQLGPLLADCTLAITHAGHGTALNCLLAGVPMVLLPLHMEQLLVAERVAVAGAGLGLLPTHVATGFANVLSEVLRNPQYRDGAGAVSARYRDVPRSRALEEITGLIEHIL
ncbi:MAG: glycosyl transferase 1 family protein [Herbaspirillum sp.]|nr:glycosyl transferase 1 family protein [Herbaspirillum sp.]